MIGQKISHYDVLDKLGEGGMGVVYRARDTKLGRDVALKVLPPALAGDAERMARFQREAQVLASLNHPNIAAIHGLEESGGVRALVMELVEGPTLADRIAQGPLPLEECVAVARQMAEALEYAHDKGVIHRDLKPANVKITPEGTVKVLDFGLAKVAEEPLAGGDPTHSPTLTLAATRAGMILGTAAYMSPEQASGRPVDKRCDIWSFGVVLWEMLSGHKLFAGETIAHTLADVLRSEIDTNRMPAGAPPAIRNLVRRCLERDVKSRLRDIGEARVVLQRSLAEPAVSAERIETPPARPRLLLGLVAALLLMLATLAVVHFREQPAELQPVRFVVPQPPKAAFRPYDVPALSPDGRNLAFTGSPGGGNNLLWLRPLDSLEARPLPGTEGAYFPFWSPDSRFIAFFGQGKLRKIEVTGGPPLTLCDLGAFTAGGSWNRDGVIVFGSGSGALQRVSASGGEPKPLLPLNKQRQETAQSWPRFLPDGRHLLYQSRSSNLAMNGIYAAVLDSPDTKLVVNSDATPGYVPPGYLLYTRQETLLAQPFDPGKLQTTGDAFPVAEGVGRVGEGLGSLYSASENGTLVFRSGNAADLRVVSYDREGKRLGAIGEPGSYRQLALSPDEKRLAIERRDPKTSTWDIWLLDLASGILSRLTFDPANDSDPVWSPDGRQVAFNSDRNGPMDLYRKTVGSAQEELLLASPERKVPEVWLPDDSILFGNLAGKTYYRIPLGGDRKPQVVLQSEFTKDEPSLSPDHKWMSYGSNESGRWEIYVASFPDFANRRQVSSSGGAQAHWRRDGKELFYLSLDGKMMVVDVKTLPAVETGVPKVLFETRLRPNPVLEQYAVTGDGRKFLFTEPLEEAERPMTVILNWTARVPRSR